MITLSVDPGSELSAYVAYDGENILDAAKVENEVLIDLIKDGALPGSGCRWCIDRIVCEVIKSYGMEMGQTTLDTCFFTGRIYQACDLIPFRGVHRKEVVTHHCGVSKAADKNVRQAMIDRFGGPSALQKPIEEKRHKRTGVLLQAKVEKGVLYDITGDMWSALAVAVYDHDTRTN